MVLWLEFVCYCSVFTPLISVPVQQSTVVVVSASKLPDDDEDKKMLYQDEFDIAYEKLQAIQAASDLQEDASSEQSCSKRTRGRVDVILGAQWGDEGKGKLVDIRSGKYAICARVAGGSNAGHTIVVDVSSFELQFCAA